MQFRVHHVAISVNEIQESIHYYAQFGFEVKYHYRDPEGEFEIAHLRLDAAFLEIFWYKNREDAPESASALSTDLPRIGVKHFGLQVEDIEEARQWVLDQGLAEDVEVRTGKTEVTYFFIKDVNGILLEFIEDKRGL